MEHKIINGKEAVLRFSKWTLTNELVGEDKYGKLSFKEYIKNCYNRDEHNSKNQK